MKKITIAGLSVLLAFLLAHCTKNQSAESDSEAARSTVPRALIPQTAFSLWQSCSTYPYLISGTNGVCVPVGGTECSTNYLGAQQSGGQYATALEFTGCFKGGSNAPNGSNEMAVFLADNVSTWNGREIGFVKTLNDNSLKAYLQGGGNYVWRVLSGGDNSYHTFKAQVQSGDHSKVDFYVDGAYQFSLQNAGQDYWYKWYYFVGTTHRTSGGWGSGGQQIEMYSMTTY